MKIRTLEQGLLPTQCRRRLVQASADASPEGWVYAYKEDGGLYDYVDGSDVSRLQSCGVEIFRVWVEIHGKS